MKGTLLVRTETDTDGDTKLFVEAEARGFRGSISTWSWEGSALTKFAASLAAYPIARDNPPVFVAGYPGQLDKYPLVFEQVRIEVKPADGSGHLVVSVSLATEPDELLNARVSFATTYEPLRRFGAELRRVAEGKATEARLDEHG